MTHPTDNRRQGEPILATHHLTVHYGHRPALSDVSITVYPGEVVGLLGPNGAGKSTLLKVIAGMVPASHGSCTYQGEEINGAHAGITYVPQRSGADWTFPISVLDAVLLGLSRKASRFRGFSADERNRALESLHYVEMERYAHVQIGALSGGQQQRVFLARALLACGSVLLLDEPFTGVDVPTQDLFVGLMDNLKKRGTAIVYATHDLAQARETSDSLIMVNRTVIATGPPTEVFRQETIRQTFGGKVVVIDHHEIAESELASAGSVAR